MLDRTVRWDSLEAKGLEHLRIWADGETLHVESVVIGTRGGNPYGFSYRMVLGDSWRARLVEIHRTGPEPTIVMQSDGNGNWHDGRGIPLDAITGCIDVDIAATPFTNTLPIRRLGLAAGETAEITTAYVPLPGLEPEPAQQRYTCIEPMARYRYEGLYRGFETELTVDSDGLVIEYPGIFRQVAGI
ncbi:MAG: transcriptional regulator [Hyphomicrobiales bacterium]|nr:MAG: transcriptional regulator [Hyphomicrobiales bacterium]